MSVLTEVLHRATKTGIDSIAPSIFTTHLLGPDVDTFEVNPIRTSRGDLLIMRNEDPDT